MNQFSNSDPDLERKKEIAKSLEINRRIEAFEEREVEFLIRFSEALRKRVPTLVPYDCYVPLISHVPEKIYFINILRNFVNPLEILKLRDECQGSRNKDLPDVAYFRTNVIDPCQFETDTIERPIMMRAEAVRAALAEVLQLRSGNKRGLAEIRDQIIIESLRQGKSNADIVKDLDACPDLAEDPLLKKWRVELGLSFLTWTDVLQHPKLQKRIKPLISKIKKRHAI